MAEAACPQALDQVKGNLRSWDDATLMASLLAANEQNLLGAVSPVLVWQGAGPRA